MESKIDEKTPKTHLRMMDKYCELRSQVEVTNQTIGLTEDSIGRIAEKEREFNENGTVDNETVRELFSITTMFYKTVMLKMQNSKKETEELHILENELKSKGYDLDTVYAVWDADPCMFEELAEGRRAVCE